MRSKAVPFHFISLAIAAFCGLAPGAVTPPLFEFLMNTQNGTVTPNTGSTSGSIQWGTLAPVKFSTPNVYPPDSIYVQLVANIPPNGGASSLNLPGTSLLTTGALDVNSDVTQLANLKSFTITGWLNRTAVATAVNGDRVVSWLNPDPAHPSTVQNGVDLVYMNDRSLKLGVNAFADNGPVSLPGYVTIDTTGSPSNWVYFAVTYDGSTTQGKTKFYFGTPNTLAKLDRDTGLVTNYTGHGSTQSNFGGGLCIGNQVSSLRTFQGSGARFKGMIDQIRIYGSATDGTGALALSDIQSIQNIPQPTGTAGVKCEIWDGVYNLQYLDQFNFNANPPSSTIFLTNLMTPTNRGDNYTMRLTGWIKAPETGNYSFKIAADDEGQFFLSTDANPANKVKIVHSSQWSPPEDYSHYAVDVALVPLIKDNYYYFEGRMKENGSNDNYAVAWTTPSGSTQSGISAGNLFLNPPDYDPLFPSWIPLYEKGTNTEKASIGWLKEANNDHFFIRTDGAEALAIKRDTVKVARNLAIGPAGEFRFHWENATNYLTGTLSLMGGMDPRPALQVSSPSELPPEVTFPNTTNFYGNNFPYNIDPKGLAFASINSYDGLIQYRNYVDASHVGHYQNSTLAANRLYLQQQGDGDFSQHDTTEVLPGHLSIRSGSGFMEGSTINFAHLYSGLLSIKSVNSMGGQSETDIGAYGITTPQLTVGSTVVATGFVSTPAWKIPDYVFEKGYKMKSLEDLETYVNTKKHLPGVPSASQIHEKGMDLSEMNVKLLKTVEELTLHLIALQKDVKAQKAEITKLSAQKKTSTSESNGRLK